MDAIDPKVVEMVQAWLDEARDMRQREKEALLAFAHTINPEAEDRGWASLDYLAEESGINRKTLSRGLIDLVNRGILVNVGRHQGRSRSSMERRITDLAWADIERVWESRRDSTGTPDSLAFRLGSRSRKRVGRDNYPDDSRRDTFGVRRDIFKEASAEDTLGTPENLALERDSDESEGSGRDSRCPLNQLTHSSSSKQVKNRSLVTGTPQNPDTSDLGERVVPRSRFDEIREQMAAKRSLQP